MKQLFCKKHKKNDDKKKKKTQDMNNTDEQNIFSIINMVYKCMAQSEFQNVFRINTSD